MFIPKKIEMDLEKDWNSLADVNLYTEETLVLIKEFKEFFSKIEKLAFEKTQKSDEEKELETQIQLLTSDLLLAQSEEDKKSENKILELISTKKSKLNSLNAIREAAKKEILSPTIILKRAEPMFDSLLVNYEHFLSLKNKKAQVLDTIDEVIIYLYEYRDKLCTASMNLDDESFWGWLEPYVEYLFDDAPKKSCNNHYILLKQKIEEMRQAKKNGKAIISKKKGKWLFYNG